MPVKHPILKYDNGNEWFDQMYRTAVTMGELPYPDHPPEFRLEVARFTCFLLHVDDLGQEFNTLHGLQMRILMGENSDGDFLQAFRQHLIGFYKLYDPIAANSITLSAIDCISGVLLEQDNAACDMKLSSCSKSWPNYLRSKTGCAEAYAFMLFPKALDLDLADYISVIDDIAFSTNAVKDILSRILHIPESQRPYNLQRHSTHGSAMLTGICDFTLPWHIIA